MIEITSKREGFRRAGVAHSVAPKQYPDDAFTEDQMQQLLGESMLTVTVLKDVEKKLDKDSVKKTGKTEGTK